MPLRSAPHKIYPFPVLLCLETTAGSLTIYSPRRAPSAWRAGSAAGTPTRTWSLACPPRLCACPQWSLRLEALLILPLGCLKNSCPSLPPWFKHCLSYNLRLASARLGPSVGPSLAALRRPASLPLPPQPEPHARAGACASQGPARRAAYRGAQGMSLE